MPLNVPGLLVPFQLIFNPRLVLPSIVVKDLRQLNFAALHRAGYRGAVFDKDNCLTLPRKDTIVPELQDAWDECLRTFGEGNVLIVSNSAGTPLDPSGIQAECVAHNTRVPVLRHQSFKPAYSCIKAVRRYFGSLRVPIRDEELIIIGDRVFTDVVMANRMKSNEFFAKRPVHKPRDAKEGGDPTQEHPCGPLAVWTSDIWEREARIMRWLEKQVVQGIRRWTKTEDDPALKEFLRSTDLVPKLEQGGRTRSILAKFRLS